MTDDNSKIEYEQTLTKIIAEKGTLSVKEATAVTLQLVKAVDNLHTEGKVHRQIHTDTVLLDQAMSAKLSPIRPLITIGGVDVGAVPCPPQLHNIPPVSLPVEIKAAQQVLTEAGIFLDPRQIDFYQLGALLCFMVSGRSVSDYLRSCKAKATVPEVIRSVIDRALGLNSKNCFSSSIAFAAALQAVVDGKTTPKSDLLRLPGSIFVEPIAKAKLQAPRDTSTASEETLPFKKLGHYQIIERIGHGGMGDVYKGYEKALDRFVAIKVLPAELGRQKDFVKRFHAEATAIAKLDHPNVVRIYYTGEDRGYHFFAMQYIDGETLAELLARRRKLSANEALPIIEQCLAGIGAAHKRGLIHRDVKPGNVILDRHSRRALVTDFGVAKAAQAGTQITVTGTIMGTADYIAPEQARGQDIDCRADLYAMGVLMYQMLSGQLPFSAESATSMMFQHAYEPPSPLAEIAPDVPSPLAGIVMKLMAKKPEDRYQSTDDVLTNLHKILLASAATVTGTSQTSIVKAPEFYTTPEVPHNLSKLTGKNWFGRLMNWITDFFGIHAPQVIDYMQTTSQQVDGAVAEYQKRRDKLAELAKEARTAATELDAQAKASRTAAQIAAQRAEAAKSTTAKHQALKEKQENEQTAAELAQLAAEQAEQSEDISLRLAKLDAKLVQLRSQRNALNARLNIAKAHLKTEDGVSTQWFQKIKPAYVIFAILLLSISAILVFMFLPVRRMTPVELVIASNQSPIGKWRSVDFVREIEYFEPGEKQWTGDLYLKGLSFYWGGKTSGPWTWKDGWLWHPGNQTKARYLIKKMNGAMYLFMEWMSGDVTIRGQKPSYYVMQKASDYVAFIIEFRPVLPFDPRTSKNLLNEFNRNLPRGVRTHHYRTKVEGNKLTGFICTDHEEGKTALANMLKRSNGLELISVRPVTQEEFEEYRRLGQPSLPPLGGNQINSGLIAYWKFDEGSGNIAYDSAGQNNGTIYGATWTTGKIGGALSFDGDGDYVDTKDFDVPGSFSISLYINPSDITDDQCFIAKNNLERGGGENIFIFGLYGGEFHVRIRNGIYTASTVSEGWQHLIVVAKQVDNAHTNVTLYKNGKVLWAKTLNDVVGNTSGESWTIGQDWDGNTRTDLFKGLIDEVRIYNKALSAEQIKQLY